MESFDFVIGKGDLLPTLTVEVTSVSTLSGATAKFRFWKIEDNENPEVTGTVRDASIVGDGSLRQIQYDWQDGDTAIPGNYYGQFDIVMPGSKPLTAPNSTKKLKFSIVENKT